MSKATGKARHPHDASRPEAPGVKKALEAIERGEAKAIEKLTAALTVRQKRFAEEYILDYNASAAALRAGYSPNHVDRQAHVVLKNKGVSAYIDHLTRSKAVKLVSVNPEYVIQKVTEIVTKEEAKDGDKLRGLELLARHLGMFIDRTELTGKDGGALQVEQRRVEEEAMHFANLMKSLTDRQQKEKLN